MDLLVFESPHWSSSCSSGTWGAVPSLPIAIPSRRWNSAGSSAPAKVETRLLSCGIWKRNRLGPLLFRQLLTFGTVSHAFRPTQQTAKLGLVATAGGHHVASYTFSKQTDRAVLHSYRAIHDYPSTRDRGNGDHPSSELRDDIDLGVITLAAGLAMILAHNIWSGGALAVVVT